MATKNDKVIMTDRVHHLTGMCVNCHHMFDVDVPKFQIIDMSQVLSGYINAVPKVSITCPKCLLEDRECGCYIFERNFAPLIREFMDKVDPKFPITPYPLDWEMGRFEPRPTSKGKVTLWHVPTKITFYSDVILHDDYRSPHNVFTSIVGVPYGWRMDRPSMYRSGCGDPHVFRLVENAVTSDMMMEAYNVEYIDEKCREKLQDRIDANFESLKEWWSRCYIPAAMGTKLKVKLGVAAAEFQGDEALKK